MYVFYYISVHRKSGLLIGVASLEENMDNLVVFLYTSDTVYVKSGLIREVAFGGNDLIKGGYCIYYNTFSSGT